MPEQHPSSQVSSRMTRPKRIAAVVVGLLLVVVVGSWALHADVARDATHRLPENVTELYFTQPNQLPTTAHVSGQELPLEFTIRNREGSPKTYNYRLIYSDGSTQVDLGQDTLVLADGQSRAFSRLVTIPAGQSRGRVSVVLSDKQQAIHWWIERN